MGAVGGLIGTSGGVNGTGISGPAKTNLDQGVTLDQTNQAYAGAQQGLASQQALLAALKGQSGIGKQNVVYNQSQNLGNQLAANNGAANLGSVYGQGQTLASQLASAGAVGNQSQALAAQQALANQQQGTAQQYQNIANGVGPNPAQAALNQSTGENVANQAALMAGQRGAGSNVGLLARQAGQQGAATQQQAVGQAATLQAQQQIAGLSGLSAQQQAIGNTNQSVAGIAGQQLAAQQAQQQALAGQAGQQVSLQQAQQQALAGQAQNQVANQMGATTALSQGQQAEQQNLLNAQGQYNSAQVGQQSSVNSANASMANTTMQGQQGLIGGTLNAVGGALSLADGGAVTPPPAPVVAPVAAPVVAAPVAAPPPGPKSSFGQFLQSWGQGIQGQKPTAEGDEPAPISSMGNSALNKGITSLGKGIDERMNRVSVTPVGNTAGPDSADVASYGAMAAKGGPVKAKDPKEKAVAKGNSYSNDKIPAMLSEGEVVIPRSVMQSKDPARSAADFVAKVLAKRRAS